MDGSKPIISISFPFHHSVASSYCMETIENSDCMLNSNTKFEWQQQDTGK